MDTSADERFEEIADERIRHRVRCGALRRQLRRMASTGKAEKCGPDSVWVIPQGGGLFTVQGIARDCTEEQVIQGILGAGPGDEGVEDFLEQARRQIR